MSCECCSIREPSASDERREERVEQREGESAERKKMLQRCRHGIRLLVSGPSSSYHTIQAVPREWTGSRVAARERTQGRIPSVVFRPGKIEDITNGKRPISKKHLLTTDRKQINSILKTVQQPFFCSTTFNLQIRAGPSSSLLLESGTVLPIKVGPFPCAFNQTVFLLFLSL